MSTPTSPVDLPHRSGTLTSSFTRRSSLSDDEAIPDSDVTKPTNLLIERLRAWKHLCAYLEDYVAATAKVQKSQSKDYEKVLKAIAEPLREAHHFSDSPGGVSSSFENLRTNTQGMVAMFLETERSLRTIVLPILERLHKEIKAKSKELHSGASKSAKAVEKARGVTQKHIELLAQQAAAFDAAAHSKIEQSHDPYILRRGINYRLNKQVIEENNNRQDVLAVQNSFQQFEAHVLQTIQGSLDQFFQVVGSQLDRQRAMYSEILANFQRIPPDFEWVNFAVRNDQTLVNPDSPKRSLSNINFPNQDHRSTKPLIEGTLERKSRAMLKGYSSGYYVVTPARYLHEYKDTDDFRRDPTPELSLYLPECLVGAIDGTKFTIKGKDVSSGKVGNAFHTNTELSFKAFSPNEAEKWWTVIKNANQGTVHLPAAADVHPPPYAEKAHEAETKGGAAAAIPETGGQSTGTTAVASGAASAATTTAVAGAAGAAEKTEKAEKA